MNFRGRGENRLFLFQTLQTDRKKFFRRQIDQFRAGQHLLKFVRARARSRRSLSGASLSFSQVA